LNGNGNGVIANDAIPIVVAGVPSEVHEELLVWMHLASAGFLSGSYAMIQGATGATDANTPKNPYNVYLQLIYDANYADLGAAVNKHNLKTGPQIPVDVIAEVDRKIDDGNGMRGAFRYSTYMGNASSAPLAPAAAYAPGQCAMTTGEWFVPQGEVNCGGASLF
jgi:hypothetical protein